MLYRVWSEVVAERKGQHGGGPPIVTKCCDRPITASHESCSVLGPAALDPRSLKLKCTWASGACAHGFLGLKKDMEICS